MSKRGMASPANNAAPGAISLARASKAGSIRTDAIMEAIRDRSILIIPGAIDLIDIDAAARKVSGARENEPALGAVERQLHWCRWSVWVVSGELNFRFRLPGRKQHDRVIDAQL